MSPMHYHSLHITFPSYLVTYDHLLMSSLTILKEKKSKVSWFGLNPVLFLGGVLTGVIIFLGVWSFQSLMQKKKKNDTQILEF